MNDRGQTLIETLFILTLLVSGLFFIIIRLIVFQKNLALDQFMQKTAFCVTENRMNCQNSLNRKAVEIGIEPVQIYILNRLLNTEISFYGKDRFKFEYKKKVVFLKPKIE